jgi:riboflavin kinase/FMN adenylyltransferase
VYDGVHVGHQALIRGLRTLAGDHLAVTVVTFRQHPAAVLAPDRVPPQLTTLDQRLELLAELGVDQVALLDFDDELRRQSPEEFVRNVLVDGLDMSVVSVGEGFRFGHGQSGDLATLAALGEAYGFEVAPTPLVGADEPYSATRIREALAAGRLAVVEEQLGRRFSVCGVVVVGDGRGRTIGVPTANLALVAHQALPPHGVYAVQVSANDDSHPAVANIGVRPTFGGTEAVLEVHILDVEEDLYERELCVEFVSHIREERAFDGVEQLVTQIKNDIATARSLL